MRALRRLTDVAPRVGVFAGLLFGLPFSIATASALEALDGDWRVTVEVDGRERAALLSFSTGLDGTLAGAWIGFRGLTQLDDVRHEDGKLTFTRVRRNRDGGSTTWRFAGTIDRGALSGTLSSGADSYRLTGARLTRMPEIVGDWAMGYNRDRVSSTLVVRADAKGALKAEWRGDGGDVPIPDFAYEDGRATFTFQGAAFDGGLRAQGNTLVGVFDSERGEVPIAGLRIASALIGTWELDITSERGSRKQRLKINRDMTGWFGATPIEIPLPRPLLARPATVGLEGRPVTFTAVARLGERTIELGFAGKVVESTLTGELTTPRGRARVTGRRVADPSASGSPVIELDSRVLEFAPTRDDLEVSIAQFNLFSSGKLTVNGEEAEHQWKYIDLESVGRNRFRLPALELEFSEEGRGYLCMSVKVWFDKLPNEIDSPYYQRVDDRYALVSWCTRHAGPDVHRFSQNRVATLREFEAVLARPFVIPLKRQRIPAPGVAVDEHGTVFAFIFLPGVPLQDRNQLWRIGTDGAARRMPLAGRRTAYWRIAPHRPSVGPGGTIYLSGLWQVAPDGAVAAVPRSFEKPQPSNDTPVAVDSRGNVYFGAVTPGHGDAPHRVELARVDSDGAVHIVAGSTAGHRDGAGDEARFIDIAAIAIEPSGHLWVADGRLGEGSWIRRVSPDGEVKTVSGGAEIGFEDGSGTAARFHVVSGLAAGKSGDLHVADRFNRAIRRVTPDGEVTTIAGRGDSREPEGLARDTAFADPAGVAVRANGEVLVLDGEREEARLWSISTDGRIETVAVLR